MIRYDLKRAASHRVSADEVACQLELKTRG